MPPVERVELGVHDDLAATVADVLGPEPVCPVAQRVIQGHPVAVADRTLTARTLARTALFIHGGSGGVPATALGVLGAEVPRRVQALLAPPPRRRRGVVGVLVALSFPRQLGGSATWR